MTDRDAEVDTTPDRDRADLDAPAPSGHGAERLRLIARLRTVFERNGYAGATFSLLSAASGLGRATLYHHFPGGKRDMAEALLADAVLEFERTALAPLRGHEKPAARLAGFVDGFARYVHDGHGQCLLAVFAQGDAQATLGPAVSDHLQRWTRLLEATLAATGLGGKRARRLAEELLDGLYGGLVVGKMTGDPEHFVRAHKRALRRIEKSL
jgi:AcrR family transcriptional regulator